MLLQSANFSILPDFFNTFYTMTSGKRLGGVKMFKCSTSVDQTVDVKTSTV